MLSRKYYKQVADALREAKADIKQHEVLAHQSDGDYNIKVDAAMYGIYLIQKRLEWNFIADNPRFNVERFRKAATD